MAYECHSCSKVAKLPELLRGSVFGATKLNGSIAVGPKSEHARLRRTRAIIAKKEDISSANSDDRIGFVAVIRSVAAYGFAKHFRPGKDGPDQPYTNGAVAAVQLHQSSH